MKIDSDLETMIISYKLAKRILIVMASNVKSPPKPVLTVLL